jgi:hypothetical protein
VDDGKTGLFYTVRQTDRSWTPSTWISEDLYAELWAIGDEVIAFVHGAFSGHGFYYIRLEGNGQWSQPWPVEDLDGMPAVDPNGINHRVWLAYDLDFSNQSGRNDESDGVALRRRIYYARTQLLDIAGNSSISQVVTLPMELSNPILSFFFHIKDPAPDGTSGMQVIIDSGLSATVVYSATASDDWTHGRADLSAWRGETVTVTLAVTQPAGVPRGWLYVDDFTIGSTYPDIWLRDCEDQAAGPGRTFTCQFRLGNRSSLTATAAVLTMTLPAELEGITFSQSPSTMANGHATWQLGDLAKDSGPTSLVMTATIAADTPLLTILDIQAALSSATPEMELWNNSASATILVAEQLLLPSIAKSK